MSEKVINNEVWFWGDGKYGQVFIFLFSSSFYREISINSTLIRLLKIGIGDKRKKKFPHFIMSLKGLGIIQISCGGKHCAGVTGIKQPISLLFTLNSKLNNHKSVRTIICMGRWFFGMFGTRRYNYSCN